MKQAIWILKCTSNPLIHTACWINLLSTQNMSFEVFWNPKFSDFIVIVPKSLILMKLVLFSFQPSGAGITHGDSYALPKARFWGKSTQGRLWHPPGWFLIMMMLISFQNHVAPLSVLSADLSWMTGINLSVILINLFTSSARISTVILLMWSILLPAANAVSSMLEKQAKA